MMRSLLLALLVLAAGMTLGGAAAAADPVAEALFTEGKGLVEQGSYAEACPKLQASHEREPRSGTLITLGFCNEKLGKTATAWGQYKDAIALAQKEGRPEFADNARKFADALEPRLTRVKLQWPAAAAPAGAAVSLDGAELPAGSVGAAIPIDPGRHRLELSATDRESGSLELEARGEGVVVSVLLPELKAKQANAIAPGTGTSAPAPAPAPAERGGGVPAWAWAIGAVGVASAGVSIGFLVDQLAAASAIEEQCGEDRQGCPRSYDFEPDRSREVRDHGVFIATGVVGVLGIGAGVVGIAVGVSGSSEEAPAALVVPWLSPELVGASVRVSL